MRPHREQTLLFHDTLHRFIVVPAGRRSGKTECLKRYIARKMLKNPGHRYFIAGPTRPQVKAIYWRDMLDLLDGFIFNASATELSITLVNGAYVQLFGLGGSSKRSNAAARIEGTPWNGGGVDEYANCPADAFDHNIRPALAEFKGWCWFIGVPEGRNHYYDLNLRGISDAYPDWAMYTWFSSDILDPEEVEAARQEMDERMFRQEFEGSYESFEGLLYYNWEDRFIRPIVVNPATPLWLSADFNKSPLVWDVYQLEVRNNRKCANAIDEIDIPLNAKTEQAARVFVNRWKNHPNKTLYLTGDASGNVESTRDWSTDYTIIRDILTEEGGFKIVFRVPPGNPNINNRVNIGCSLFAHERFLVDPKCHRLINDFQRNEGDGKGAKDKTDPQQTHGSDNFDYFIWQNFASDFYRAGVRQL